MFDPEADEFDVLPGCSVDPQRKAAGEKLLSGQAVEDELFSRLEVGHLSEEARFASCTFENCRFGDLTVSGVEFQRCVFRACSFVNASFDGVKLLDCIIEPTDGATGTNSWAGARVARTLFESCRIKSIDFKKCDLSSATFERSRIDRCGFDDARFVKTPSTHTYFTNLEWRDSVIVRSDLQRSDLRGVHLTNCYLETVSLQDSDLEGADLSGSRLSNVRLLRTVLHDANLCGTTFEECDLLEAESWFRAKVTGDGGDCRSLLRALGFSIRVSSHY